MNLGRLGPSGREIPVIVDGHDAFDLRPLTADIDAAFLSDDPFGRAGAALASGDLSPVRGWRDLRIGPPVARPQAVICVGLNYAAHARESGAAPPAEPVVFFKHPNTIVGPNDPILLPPGAQKLDWEVELAIVIGGRARYLESREQAVNHIAGYCISNDVSERSYQIERSGGQWSKGKSFETFNPLGPWLVDPKQIPEEGARIQSSVNGAPRQDSTTRDMIFDPAELVFTLSQFLCLEAGDVINTGTPEGVALSGRFPFLQAGDTVRMEIAGLGTQEQIVRALKGSRQA